MQRVHMKGGEFKCLTSSNPRTTAAVSVHPHVLFTTTVVVHRPRELHRAHRAHCE